MLKPRKRLTKKQLKEDKLLTTVVKVQTYLETEWKRLAVVAGSAFVIVLLGFVLYQRNTAQEQEASSKLYALEFEYIEKRIYNTQLIQDLQELIEQHGGTVSAGTALIHLGNAYYFLGDFANAEQYYQLYFDQYKTTDFLSSSALAGIAACNEQLENFDKAIQYYLQSANDYPNEFITPDNILGAVRTLLLTGNDNDAFIQCQNIISSFPNSSAAREAEVILARQAQARQ